MGLFDTYHATHVLGKQRLLVSLSYKLSLTRSRPAGYPQHSLAYLLERYTNFEADKRYQLADWRIR